MTTQVKLIAFLTARPQKADDLETLLTGMAPHCRAEPGNLHWEVWRDQSDPTRFVLDESYRDMAATAAHRETPHYKDYLAKIGDLAERSVIALDPVDIS